jgi:4-hydroxyphenylpyruvate dioxygenase-like putative hemolysin
MALEDAETGDLEWVDTSSKAWRDAFEARVIDLEAQKRQLLTSRSIDHIQISTDREYIIELNEFFARRSRRRAR